MFHTYNWSSLTLRNVIPVHSAESGTIIDTFGSQKYYQLADVFVNASTSETQGLTYIEAAANGLPLLCRKDPCLMDVIKDGVNGYEYTNTPEFINHLNDILMNPEWRKTASEQSEKIAESFDKEHFVESVEDIYEEITE